MNANELADKLEYTISLGYPSKMESQEVIAMLRQQQAEIEALKNANRFIQNFAQEQHQRTVALEMRELTDEEIIELFADTRFDTEERISFAKAILRKASEK